MKEYGNIVLWPTNVLRSNETVFSEEMILQKFDQYLKDNCNSSIEQLGDYSINIATRELTNLEVIKLTANVDSFLTALHFVDTEFTTLEFIDPRANANRFYSSSFETLFKRVLIKLNAGDLLVFPSYVYFMTEPSNCKRQTVITAELTKRMVE